MAAKKYMIARVVPWIVAYSQSINYPCSTPWSSTTILGNWLFLVDNLFSNSQSYDFSPSTALVCPLRYTSATIAFSFISHLIYTQSIQYMMVSEDNKFN